MVFKCSLIRMFFPIVVRQQIKKKRTGKIKKEERYRKLKQPIYSTIADLGLLRTF